MRMLASAVLAVGLSAAVSLSTVVLYGRFRPAPTPSEDASHPSHDKSQRPKKSSPLASTASQPAHDAAQPATARSTAVSAPAHTVIPPRSQSSPPDQSPQPIDCGIFWDIENVHPPTGVDGTAVVHAIRSMVQSTTVPVGDASARPAHIRQFRAYRELSSSTPTSERVMRLRDELQSSGVTLADTPHAGRKNKADFMLATDMALFALDYPAPARIVLITGDGDLAYSLSTLHGRGYQVILVVPSFTTSSMALRSVADVVLRFREDVMHIDPSSHQPLSTPQASSGPPHEGKHSHSPPALAAERALPPVQRTTSTSTSSSSSAAKPEAGAEKGFMNVLLPYAPLIELLLTLPPDVGMKERDPSAGRTRQLRAKVASLIQREYGPGTYVRAGSDGWTQYAAEAERIGLVKMGRFDAPGFEWVELVENHALVTACQAILTKNPKASLPTIRSAVAASTAASRPPVLVELNANQVNASTSDPTRKDNQPWVKSNYFAPISDTAIATDRSPNSQEPAKVPNVTSSPAHASSDTGPTPATSLYVVPQLGPPAAAGETESDFQLQKRLRDVATAGAAGPSESPFVWREVNPRRAPEQELKQDPATRGRKKWTNEHTAMWQRDGDVPIYINGIKVAGKYALLVRILQDQRASGQMTSTPVFLWRLHNKLHGDDVSMNEFIQFLKAADIRGYAKLTPSPPVRPNQHVYYQFVSLHPLLCPKEEKNKEAPHESSSTQFAPQKSLSEENESKNDESEEDISQEGESKGDASEKEAFDEENSEEVTSEEGVSADDDQLPAATPFGVPVDLATGCVNVSLWRQAPSTLHGQDFPPKYRCLVWLLYEQYQLGWSTTLFNWVRSSMVRFHGLESSAATTSAAYWAWLNQAVKEQVIVLLAPTKPPGTQYPIRLHPRFGLDYNKIDMVRLGRKLFTVYPSASSMSRVFDQWELDVMCEIFPADVLREFGLKSTASESSTLPSPDDVWEDKHMSVRTHISSPSPRRVIVHLTKGTKTKTSYLDLPVKLSSAHPRTRFRALMNMISHEGGSMPLSLLLQRHNLFSPRQSSLDTFRSVEGGLALVADALTCGALKVDVVRPEKEVDSAGENLKNTSLPVQVSISLA